jgi:Amt family ammonium transporter
MEKRNYLPLIILLVIALLGAFVPSVPTKIVTEGLNSGDIAWMLVSSALVLLMTPGLAYFYGGMVNNKNVISTMLQSFIAMGVISVLWVVVGFSLAFGDDIGGFIGNPTTHFMFKGVLDGPAYRFHGRTCEFPFVCSFHDPVLYFRLCSSLSHDLACRRNSL